MYRNDAACWCFLYYTQFKRAQIGNLCLCAKMKFAFSSSSFFFFVLFGWWWWKRENRENITALLMLSWLHASERVSSALFLWIYLFRFSGSFNYVAQKISSAQNFSFECQSSSFDEWWDLTLSITQATTISHFKWFITV